jgi:LacI family transcriptional regulator, galactose operon repressor
VGDNWRHTVESPDQAVSTLSKAVTSHDVARAAGVSQSTVSRALRGDPRVSESTMLRISEAVRALGYVPSELGRSLSTRSARTVGVVIGDLRNPFYPYIVAPLHEQFSLLDYRMLLFTTETGEADALFKLVDHTIDGVVLSSPMIIESPSVKEMLKRRLPVVFFNRLAQGIPADSATVDNVKGGFLAGDELARLGHSRIGALFGDPETSTGRDRELGFRAALTQNGLDLSDQLVRHELFTFDSGHEGIQELLETPDPPTAVFCGNDVVGLGALNGAAHRGAKVPEDVSIIAFDDIPPSSWELFSLATVRQPMNEMAGAAARLLIERIEADQELPARHHVFEPELIRRRTLAAPRQVVASRQRSTRGRAVSPRKPV